MVAASDGASLPPDELVRQKEISRKEELRCRLAELQLQLCGPQQAPGSPEADMKRAAEDAPEVLPSQAPPASKILRGLEEAGPAPPATPRATGAVGGTARCHQRPQNVMAVSRPGRDANGRQLAGEDSELTSLKTCWQKAKFRLRLLEGHNDIITCVLAVDNLVISGSRDTTVKVWHVPTATEHKNLGGHTGGVTSLSAPPAEYCKKLAWSLSLPDDERFILSGSADCNVKIWALSIGQCVKSIYTFNAVTALSFVPEGDGYIVTGSDGGKVQAWSWRTLDNCQSINAHQEAVTSIQCQGPLVFSGSSDGGVSVWENRCRQRDPLRLLHGWSGQVTGCAGGRLALSPRGERVLLAYGRPWINILHWITGTVSRLTNHSSVTGVTDCVHQTAGLLIGSCYDVANGESTLNLFSLPQCHYLASLTWPRAPRMLCFAAWTTGSGDHRWVSGGRDLVVWEQLPASRKQSSIAPVARLTALVSLVLVVLVTRPSACHRDDEGEERAEAPAVQLSVGARATPTPLWAVVWGPTQPLEDETYHLLSSSQETERLRQRGSQREAGTAAASSADWLYHDASTHPREDAPPESWNRGGAEDGGAEEAELEEVDPQFYVTVTISTLLILTAIIITAKLCYDRGCSRHPPPMSRGVAPPLSRALPCSLPSEESRQTLHSASFSFADRERIPVVNL
ncbi:uncharacterized protein LOC127600482 isoform X2 [Hippocampus zosterae]|uniref:uncharacterized protein LOC127600482 isoform X2 n=1 Tax=Hippocampus zosterae TaxID=109293 RepID=UPI00223E77A0|nr:uncharacterized protein LOC127600482 isoform X2 [Hippocampus zosterae]